MQTGDIFLIYNATYRHKPLGKHSFVVVNTKPGVIGNERYDFVACIMSSMETEDKIKKYYKFPGNFSILKDDRVVEHDNNKAAFVKLDQLFYFNLKKIKYKRFGYVKEDVKNLIFEYVNELASNNEKFVRITENLKKKEIVLGSKPTTKQIHKNKNKNEEEKEEHSK